MENRKDIEKELEKDIECPPKLRRRSSFFGYNSVESIGQRERRNAKEIELYMKKLQDEYGEWPTNYVRIKKKLLEFWRKESEEDNSFLSKEQQEYLEKAVDVDEYLKDSSKLCAQIESYIMNKEWLLERYQFCMEVMHDKAKEDELHERMILRDQIGDYIV